MNPRVSKLVVFMPDDVALSKNQDLLLALTKEYREISVYHSSPLSSESLSILSEIGCEVIKLSEKIPFQYSFITLINRLKFYSFNLIRKPELAVKISTIINSDNVHIKFRHFWVGYILALGYPLYSIIVLMAKLVKVVGIEKKLAKVDFLSLNPTSRLNHIFINNQNLRYAYSSLRNIDEICLKGPFVIDGFHHFAKYENEAILLRQTQKLKFLSEKYLKKFSKHLDTRKPVRSVLLVTVHSNMFPDQANWVDSLISYLGAKGLNVSLSPHPHDKHDYSHLGIKVVSSDLVKRYDAVISHSSTVCLDAIEVGIKSAFFIPNPCQRAIHMSRTHAKLMLNLGVTCINSVDELSVFLDDE